MAYRPCGGNVRRRAVRMGRARCGHPNEAGRWPPTFMANCCSRKRRPRSGACAIICPASALPRSRRSEEHTSELQSLMRISYAVFFLKKKKKYNQAKTREEKE